jgi:hypothetical protein
MAPGWEDEEFSEADREEYLKATIERLKALAAWPSESLALDKRLAAFDTYHRALWQFDTRRDDDLLIEAVKRTEPEILAQALANLASLAFEYHVIARKKAEIEGAEIEGEDE